MSSAPSSVLAKFFAKRLSSQQWRLTTRRPKRGGRRVSPYVLFRPRRRAPPFTKLTASMLWRSGSRTNAA